MDGFRWFPVVSGSFWVVSGGFSCFQVVLAPFRSFLVLVSTIIGNVKVITKIYQNYNNSTMRHFNFLG